MDCGGGPLAIITFLRGRVGGLTVTNRGYSNPISDLSCSGGITPPRCRSGLVPVRGRDEEQR